MQPKYIEAIAGQGFKVKTGGATARAGLATLVGGTVTVANTSVQATDLIQLTCVTPGGTQGFLSYTITGGTSFTINSSSVSDTSVVNWEILGTV